MARGTAASAFSSGAASSSASDKGRFAGPYLLSALSAFGLLERSLNALSAFGLPERSLDAPPAIGLTERKLKFTLRGALRPLRRGHVDSAVFRYPNRIENAKDQTP